MAIKRYYATKDNTITNAYKADLETRATGANMGAADVVEVFSIYGQATTSSSEVTRILLQFDITGSGKTPKTDRTNNKVPASGSVSWYLHLFNAAHSFTVPRDFKLLVSPITRYWEEGTGLDMDTYKDLTYTNQGSNWVQAASGTNWTSEGGDFSVEFNSTGTFQTGLEDLRLDVTHLVEQWISGDVVNSGMIIRLSESYEPSSSTNTIGATKSYYTKKFFGRGTQYFFKQPYLEARWNSARKDNRGNFNYSSSVAPAADNLNTIYLYNRVRGRLVNLPVGDTGLVFISLYSGSDDNSKPTGSSGADDAGLVLVTDGTHVTSVNTSVVTGGYVSTGIYSCSVATTAAATALTTLFDVWFTGSPGQHVTGGTHFHTGTISPSKLTAQTVNLVRDYTSKITNLKSTYRSDETARMRVFTRKKDWNPTIYTVASVNIEPNIIESGSYRVVRVIDSLEVLPHGTGSDYQTMMSYDVSGSYFDLDMDSLQPGYAYGIKLAFYDEILQEWVEQPEIFKFKVERYDD